MSDIKMSDEFELPVRRHYSALIDKNGAQCSYLSQVDCAAHAINNHDKLTEQNKRLIEALDEALGWMDDHPAMPGSLHIHELLYKIKGGE